MKKLFAIVMAAAVVLTGCTAKKVYDTPDLSVSYRYEIDLERTQEAVAYTKSWFKQHGFPVDLVHIEISYDKNLPANLSDAESFTSGQYFLKEKKIIVMDYWKMQHVYANKFKITGKTSMFQMGTLIHEITHAILNAIGVNTIGANEYIATVVEISSYDYPTRRAIRYWTDDEFEDASEINGVNYLKNPQKFQAMAWHHFIRTDIFFSCVMSGKTPYMECPI